MAKIPAFTEDQYCKALDRLIIYAQRKFIRLGWRNKDGFRSPQGQGPDDIASEAIVRIIEGRRIYDKEKCPDFEKFLNGCVDSIISHIIDSPDFNKSKAMPCIITNGGETEEMEYEGRETDPLQTCIEKDTVKQIESILEKNFSEDKIVLGIFECFKEGIYKRSELSMLLEVDVKEIDNAQKRLQRAMDKYLRNKGSEQK